MPCEPKGCGRSGLTLTLYLISAQSIDALSTGFNLLRCGYFPTSFDPDAVGMLLCDTCAHRCGFPEAKASATHGQHGSSSDRTNGTTSMRARFSHDRSAHQNTKGPDNYSGPVD